MAAKETAAKEGLMAKTKNTLSERNVNDTIMKQRLNRSFTTRERCNIPSPIRTSSKRAKVTGKQTIRVVEGRLTRTLAERASTLQWKEMSVRSRLRTRYRAKDAQITRTRRTRQRLSITTRTSYVNLRICRSSASSLLSHWLRESRSVSSVRTRSTSEAPCGTASSAANPSISAASSDGSSN